MVGRTKKLGQGLRNLLRRGKKEGRGNDNASVGILESSREGSEDEPRDCTPPQAIGGIPPNESRDSATLDLQRDRSSTIESRDSSSLTVDSQRDRSSTIESTEKTAAGRIAGGGTPSGTPRTAKKKSRGLRRLFRRKKKRSGASETTNNNTASSPMSLQQQEEEMRPSHGVPTLDLQASLSSWSSSGETDESDSQASFSSALGSVSTVSTAGRSRQSLRGVDLLSTSQPPVPNNAMASFIGAGLYNLSQPDEEIDSIPDDDEDEDEVIAIVSETSSWSSTGTFETATQGRQSLRGVNFGTPSPQPPQPHANMASFVGAGLYFSPSTPPARDIQQQASMSLASMSSSEASFYFAKALSSFAHCNSEPLDRTAAALRIQTCYKLFKSHLLLHEHRAHLARRMVSATRIQAAWRGWIVRDQLIRFLRTQLTLKQFAGAATVVQAAVRGSNCRTEIRKYSAAALRIQICWVACLARKYAKKQRRRDVKVRYASASLIQAKWKGWVARDLLRQRSAACTRIQTQWRAKRARSSLACSRSSATDVQAAWRGFVCRQHLQTSVVAVLRIQILWIEYSTKKHAKEQLSKELFLRKASASCIQDHWKRWSARNRKIQEAQAFTIIKKEWQCLCAKTMLQRSRSAAIAMQAAFRGHVCRRDIRERTAAAMRIQCMYRVSLSQKCLSWKRAVARVQRKFLEDAGATQIQARWRGHTDRNGMVRRTIASIEIQTQWRCLTLRLTLHRSRSAAIVIQTAFRRFVSRQQLRDSCAAIVRIQSWCRASSGRSRVMEKRAIALSQQEAEKDASSSTLMQAAWRACVCRQHLQTSVVAVLRIQIWWIKCLTRKHAKEQHSKVVISRNAGAACIQNCWKSWAVRNREVQETQACTTIQRQWRCLCAKAMLQRSRSAAIAIQAASRGHVCHRELGECTAAAMRIQCVFRVFLSQRCVDWKRAVARVQRKFLEDASATKIQAWWRGHTDRDQIVCRTTAAIEIQSQWRCLSLKLTLDRSLSAAIVIQSAFRRFVCRQWLRDSCAVIVRIQSWCRASLSRSRVMEKRAIARSRREAQKNASSSMIQAQWRGRLARNHVVRRCLVARLRTLQLHRSTEALVEKIPVRGSVSREKLQESVVAVMRIQRRALDLARSVDREEAGASSIQGHWRRWVARNQKDTMRTSSCSKIQVMWRSHRTSSKRRRLQASAAVVQAAVRRYLSELRAQERTVAVIRIQSRYRASTSQKCVNWKRTVARVQRKFVEDASATQIQARWRGHTDRNQMLCRKTAAIEIQNQWRCLSSRLTLNRFRVAASVIQTAFRWFVCRQQLRYTCATVIRIQSWCRASLSRSRVMEKRAMARSQREAQKETSSSTLMQAAWHGCVCRQHLQTSVVAVLRIQIWWIECSKRKHAKEQHSKEVALRNASAACIQDRWKSWAARTREFRETGACTTIQKQWRCLRAKAMLHRSQASATVVQASVRRFLSDRRAQERSAAIIRIQSMYRASLSQRFVNWKRAVAKVQRKFLEIASATQIQTRWRGHTDRCQMVCWTKASAKIQCQWRCLCAKLKYQRSKSAATVLQAFFRGCRCRQEIEERCYAALRIQSMYRASTSRIRLATEVTSAALIQSKWRGRIARDHLLCRSKAGVKIQSQWRCLVATRKLQQTRSAAIVAQAAFRGGVFRQELQERSDAAMRIQRLVRISLSRACQKEKRAMVQARRLATAEASAALIRELTTRTVASTKIQSRWRCFRAKWSLKLFQSAAIVLQTSYRKCFYQQRLQKILAMTRAMQTWHRVALNEKRLREKNALVLEREAALHDECATLIQANTKGWIVRDQQHRHSISCAKIQNQFRTLRAQASLERSRSGAVAVQAALRGCGCRRLIRYRSDAAIQIQSWYRSLVSRRCLKDKRAVVQAQNLCEDASATLIQAQWRRQSVSDQILQKTMACTKIQSQWRLLSAKATLDRSRSAATILQAALRGVACRRLLEARSAWICADHSPSIECSGSEEGIKTALPQSSSFRDEHPCDSLLNSEVPASKVKSKIEWFQTLFTSSLVQDSAGADSRRELQERTAAVIRIQRCLKAILWQRRLNEQLATNRTQREAMEYASATLIQTEWKGRVVRNHRIRQTEACTKIQNQSRCLSARLALHRNKLAAIVVRRVLRQQEFQGRSEAAVRIQSWYRLLISRRRFTEHPAVLEKTRRTKACTKIQSHWRFLRARLALADSDQPHRNELSLLVCATEDGIEVTDMGVPLERKLCPHSSNGSGPTCDTGLDSNFSASNGNARKEWSQSIGSSSGQPLFVDATAGKEGEAENKAHGNATFSREIAYTKVDSPQSSSDATAKKLTDESSEAESEESVEREGRIPVPATTPNAETCVNVDPSEALDGVWCRTGLFPWLPTFIRSEREAPAAVLKTKVHANESIRSKDVSVMSEVDSRASERKKAGTNGSENLASSSCSTNSNLVYVYKNGPGGVMKMQILEMPHDESATMPKKSSTKESDIVASEPTIAQRVKVQQHCVLCGKVEPLFSTVRCIYCKDTVYCSMICRRKDRLVHKAICFGVKKEISMHAESKTGAIPAKETSWEDNNENASAAFGISNVNEYPTKQVVSLFPDALPVNKVSDDGTSGEAASTSAARHQPKLSRTGSSLPQRSKLASLFEEDRESPSKLIGEIEAYMDANEHKSRVGEHELALPDVWEVCYRLACWDHAS